MGTDVTDVDTTTYQFEIPSDTWNKWRDTVPRTVPLYARIETLIKMDAERADVDDVETTQLVTMQYNRIRQRSLTARDALDRGDEEKAREELQAIADVANAFAD